MDEEVQLELKTDAVCVEKHQSWPTFLTFSNWFFFSHKLPKKSTLLVDTRPDSRLKFDISYQCFDCVTTFHCIDGDDINYCLSFFISNINREWIRRKRKLSVDSIDVCVEIGNSAIKDIDTYQRNFSFLSCFVRSTTTSSSLGLGEEFLDVSFNYHAKRWFRACLSAETC